MADATYAGSRPEPTTIVHEGTHFKGEFISSCPIIVNGQIEGDVKAPAVTVNNSGALQGNVEAKTIACRGTVSGVLEADTIESRARLLETQSSVRNGSSSTSRVRAAGLSSRSAKP